MTDAVISFAVEKLGDALIQKVNFLKGVEGQVRWVKDELESMRCFLKDAAEKQGQDERIRQWIREVREVAQDAENVIEIFTLKLETPTSMRDRVRKWAGYPAHVSHLNRVGKEIESIRTRLHEIRERRERYGIRNLGEVGMETSLNMVELQRRIPARFQKDKDVVGLNEDTDLLLNKVILDDSRKGLSIAAIVGMGGIGKSTLARKIYNHPDIADRFELRAWVVVSSEFAAEDIIKQIIHELSVPLDANELKTLESIQEKLRRHVMLQEMLRQRLEGKHYFIVLDDVWERTHWDLLKNAFPDEQGEASRLLFTSRKEIFTKHLGYIHKMRVLDPDESWELLLKTTLIGERCPQELEDIGKKILEKCHGLPLAITVAGGLLVNQGESKIGWDRVLRQMQDYHSETSEIGKNVSAILELSYHNLPSHIKPCFLCLAFFKEDAVFRPKRLMHIWVALGFVQVQKGGGETVEERARSYLDELINRNLVQVKDMTINDRVKYCNVHDLLRELSIKKAKEEIGFESLTSEDHEGSSSSSSFTRHRVVQGIRKGQNQNGTSNQNKHLRSLFLHVEGLEYDDSYFFSTPSYWKGFELLRILDIEGSIFKSLPSTIRALIGIRYLRLQVEGGRLRLPIWLDALKNLEVLEIADCMFVTFPDVTWKMNSLRHFYIGCVWYEFPKSMTKSSWPNLETLKFTSSNVHKTNMEILLMGINSRDRQTNIERVLVGINSLDHLTKLKLRGSLSMRPSADMFPQGITHLTLCAFHTKEGDLLMEELGKLPNLLALKLVCVSVFVVSIKVSGEGFPRLKVLDLRNMLWLENIEIEEGGMPELQRLQIQKCPRLQGIEDLRESISPAEIIFC